MQVNIDTLVNADGTVIQYDKAENTKANDQIDKNAFLNLLCTQLKYQDPLNPQSDSDMAAQLAQFSALECMQDIKTAIQDQTDVFSSAVSAMQYSALSTTNSSSISLIGKTVMLERTELDFSGQEILFDIHLGNNSQATVHLLNEDGETVKTLSASDKNVNNSVALSWDGTTDQGKIADHGTYTIQIEGQDTDKELYCFVEDRVSGVRFTDDGPIVKINGIELSIGKILEIAES